MNLLKETISDLLEHGKTLDDVVWVGTREVEIPIKDFLKLADKHYDAGFGSPKVATDLLVCGDGWYMERHEYDGSEWWEFKTMPTRPNRVVIPKVIVDDEFMWCSLERMNDPNEGYSDEPFDWEGMEVDFNGLDQH